MEGLHILPHPIHATRGLDDKGGSEGCIPSDTNPCRAPTSPPVPMGAPHLPVSVSSIRVDISPTGLLQSDEPVVGALQHMEIRLAIYLDDILFLHQSKTELVQMTPLICKLFKALGLVVNQKKSVLTPDQIMEFLGFQVNTVTLQLVFPLRKLKQLAQHLHQQNVTVREIARFVGKASMATRAVWQAPLHYRALQFSTNLASWENHSVETEVDISTKFDTYLTLNTKAQNDLKWWCTLDKKVQLQSPLLPRTLSMTKESDASNTGWGACQGHHQIGENGPWRRPDIT